MKTVVFAASKGGTGKSTLCFNVAIEAARKSQVFLADLDPQQSLKRMWSGRNDVMNPRLVTKVTDLGQSIKLLKEAGYDREYMFVDTPGSFLDHIARAAQAADLIVAPVQPSPVDWPAQQALCDMLTSMGMRSRLMVVISRSEGKSDLVDRTREYFGLYTPFQMPLIKSRMDYKRGAEMGQSAFEVAGNKEAGKEIRDLWEAIKKALAVVDATMEIREDGSRKVH